MCGEIYVPWGWKHSLFSVVCVCVCAGALVSSLGLELVGPYHVLARRLEGVTWDRCVLHYRYFYDPPEMVTVLRRKEDQYHLGYFRWAWHGQTVGFTVYAE